MPFAQLPTRLSLAEQARPWLAFALGVGQVVHAWCHDGLMLGAGLLHVIFTSRHRARVAAQEQARRKLGLRDRVQVVVFAFENGLAGRG